MAGQSDAPDDLIAELARLMASDARPDTAPKEPQAPQSVRVPDSDVQKMPPVPRFEFAITPPTERPAQPVPPSAPRAPEQAAPAAATPTPQPQVRVPTPPPAQPQAAPQVRVPTAPVAEQRAPAPNLESFGLRPSVTTSAPPPRSTPVDAPVEPFAFDFELNSGRPSAAQAAPAPTATPAPAQPQPTAIPAAPGVHAFDEPVVSRPIAPEVSVDTPAPRQEQHNPQPTPAPQNVEEESDTLDLDHDSLADLIAAELANADILDAQRAASAVEVEIEVEPETVAPQADDFFAQVAPSAPAFEPVRAQTQAQPAPGVAARSERSAPQFAEPSFEQAPEPTSASVAPKRNEPSFGDDPLAEIERLVGPAVRMSVQPESKPEPAVAAEEHSEPAAKPAPIRSLATPTLPTEQEKPTRGPRRRASVADTGSVDDAILAAAAASGANVEWVDHSADRAGSDRFEADEKPSRKRRSFGISRAVLGPVLALLLLGVGGGALYFMLGQGGVTGPAPTIVADTAPIKEVPEPSNQETPQSVIFNEMAGGNNGDNEQIVPRDQADAETISQATQNSGIGNVINAIDQGTTNPDGLVNRRVRTVTVRPDGTIVSGDTGLAGTSMLPVDRPNVPDLPGNTAPTTTTETAAVSPEPTPTPAAAQPVTPVVPPVQPGSVVPVVNASGAAIAGRTVAIPSQKPSDFAATAQAAIAAAAAAPATTAPAPQAAAAPVATSGGSGAAYVQLSSQRTEAAARESAQAIATRYGVLFGGANLEIQQVNLGERGIYYRVLVPAASRDAAVNICTNVRAAGGDCLLL